MNSLIYLVTFGSQQTLSRRDNAVRYLRMTKAIMCHMLLGLLLWNRDRPRPSGNFEKRVVRTFEKGIYHIFSTLSIPTWNRTRHYFTKNGMNFRRAMMRRVERHRIGFTRFQFEIHSIFEEVKEAGTIENHETTRLTDFARILQEYAEQLVLIKEYRTTNVARSFIRVFMLLCPPMMAVYFSFLSGNIAHSPATTPFVYALILFMASMALLLLLVHVNRSLEDPTTTDFKGDMIDIPVELNDAFERFSMLAEYCKEKRELREEYEMEENQDSVDNESLLEQAMEEVYFPK